MNINKSKLIKKINQESSISTENSSALLESFLQFIKDNLKSGTIKISGFGTFKKKITPKRIGRNPKTGKEHVISQSNRVSFSVSNAVKKILN